MKRILIIDNTELLTPENTKGYAEINRRHSFEYKVLTADKEQYVVRNYICDFAGGEE